MLVLFREFSTAISWWERRGPITASLGVGSMGSALKGTSAPLWYMTGALGTIGPNDKGSDFMFWYSGAESMFRVSI